MPLLALLLGFFFPRIIVLVLYFFTDWWSNAFDGVLLPLLGFLFMPITLLWYGVSEAYFSSTVQLVGLVVAVLLDLGIVGGSARKRRRA